MKKWLTGIVVLFVLFWVTTYFFIPRKLFVTAVTKANVSQSASYRFLLRDSNWQKWWPGLSNVEDSSTVFVKDGFKFKKSKYLYNAFEILIEKNNSLDSSLLRIFSLSKDSVTIEWDVAINTGLNPFTKIGDYLKAKKLKHELEIILSEMQKYISDVKNLYGFAISKEKVKIEYMMSARKAFTHYPTTQDVYEIISQVKKHIASEKAEVTDSPMLHITTGDSINFEAQVAVPINRKINDSGIFSSKKMLKGGNILVTEISGGPSKADLAIRQMDLYILDNKYNIVAIPFYSLVTDRLAVPDSSNWVTKVYYPVM